MTRFLLSYLTDVEFRLARRRSRLQIRPQRGVVYKAEGNPMEPNLTRTGEQNPGPGPRQGAALSRSAPGRRLPRFGGAGLRRQGHFEKPQPRRLDARISVTFTPTEGRHEEWSIDHHRQRFGHPPTELPVSPFLAPVFSRAPRDGKDACVPRSYPGNDRVELRTLPTPHPGHVEVLLRVKASTICGSDICCIYHEHSGKGPEGYQGVIAGHEPSGKIVEAGPAAGALV